MALKVPTFGTLPKALARQGRAPIKNHHFWYAHSLEAVVDRLKKETTTTVSVSPTFGTRPRQHLGCSDIPMDERHRVWYRRNPLLVSNLVPKPDQLHSDPPTLGNNPHGRLRGFAQVSAVER